MASVTGGHESRPSWRSRAPVLAALGAWAALTIVTLAFWPDLASRSRLSLGTLALSGPVWVTTVVVPRWRMVRRMCMTRCWALVPVRESQLGRFVATGNLEWRTSQERSYPGSALARVPPKSLLLDFDDDSAKLITNDGSRGAAPTVGLIPDQEVLRHWKGKIWAVEVHEPGGGVSEFRAFGRYAQSDSPA